MQCYPFWSGFRPRTYQRNDTTSVQLQGRCLLYLHSKTSVHTMLFGYSVQIPILVVPGNDSEVLFRVPAAKAGKFYPWLRPPSIEVCKFSSEEKYPCRFVYLTCLYSDFFVCCYGLILIEKCASQYPVISNSERRFYAYQEHCYRPGP